MRWIVNFAHRRYLDLQRRIAEARMDFAIPEGIYRQLAVVVEAKDEDSAIERAREYLGWPDAEGGLVPMGVVSQAEATEHARRHLNGVAMRVRVE